MELKTLQDYIASIKKCNSVQSKNKICDFVIYNLVTIFKTEFSSNDVTPLINVKNTLQLIYSTHEVSPTFEYVLQRIIETCFLVDEYKNNNGWYLLQELQNRGFYTTKWRNK